MKILFKIYQKIISPIIHSFIKVVGGNPYSGCRFEPTCSCYSEQAIERYGLIKGSIKTIYRISRCHPFSGPGGYDPV